MTAQPAKRKHGPVNGGCTGLWCADAVHCKGAPAGQLRSRAAAARRARDKKLGRGGGLAATILAHAMHMHMHMHACTCKRQHERLFTSVGQASPSNMAQQVGFTRSKTKPLSPGFFPAEKERQFAESQQSDPQQRAEEQDEMPPPPARPNEPAAQSQERAAGQTLRAYSLDGPVEAVGLQADSEFWQVFEDIETLGRGHFAKVKLVSHLHTREEFAAKILDKTTADNDIEDLVREFQMLRSLRHPNIIRLFAAYETPRKLYLVTEVADPSTT